MTLFHVAGEREKGEEVAGAWDTPDEFQSPKGLWT